MLPEIIPCDQTTEEPFPRTRTRRPWLPPGSTVRIGGKTTADDSEVGGIGEDNKVTTGEKLVAH